MNETLKLRPLEKKDLEFMHQLRIDPDVMEYWWEEPYTTMERLQAAYDNGQQSDSIRQFILYLDDKRAGYVSLFDIDPRHNHAEFGIIIAPDQQGKGLAADATRLIMDYGFNQMNLHKLYLYVDKQNEKAIHIYEKVGFQIEGELKEHFFVRGKYNDALFMSVLKKDFDQFS